MPRADEADLPQDQERTGVDRPPPHEEVRCLVALAAAGRWVEAEIGNQAVHRGDPGQHPCTESLRLETPDRVMARPGENAGMSVEDRADVGSPADARDDLVRDRGIDLPPL